MKLARVLLGAAVVGVVVALTYWAFESLVHGMIDLLWTEILDTPDFRLMALPATLGLGMLYFWAQHRLDPKAEKKVEGGLGTVPKPTPYNYSKVLLLGFLSLVAGASLGPEAVLVPASLVVGGMVAKRTGQQKLLATAGLVAIFAAFFHSFVVGMLGLALAVQQLGAKRDFNTVFVAVVASASSYAVLTLIDPVSYFALPATDWQPSFETAIAMVVLVIVGYYSTHLLHGCMWVGEEVKKELSKQAWWVKGLVATAGLATLYLLGGELVQFTGNKSIKPMLEQASTLGVLGLAWLVLIKLMAIGWSKALGYRGGLIFPLVFVACTYAAIAQELLGNVNLAFAMVAVLVGLFAADRKVKILF